MPHPLKAVYHNGTFILKTDCHLPEGAEVELWVNSSRLIPPKISNPGEKAIAVLLWQVACEYLAASRKLEPLGYDR
ncbi:hypothetical protein APPUASWS_001250 [Arthrospira platensis str. Paraca]|nr:hypothetical protein APPUASWS_001250 [Arthrospira platensis str. Paraca]